MREAHHAASAESSSGAMSFSAGSVPDQLPPTSVQAVVSSPIPRLSHSLEHCEEDSRSLESLSRKLSHHSLKDLLESSVSIPLPDPLHPRPSSSLSSLSHHSSRAFDISLCAVDNDTDMAPSDEPHNSFLGSTTSQWAVDRWLGYPNTRLQTPTRNTMMIPTTIKARIRADSPSFSASHPLPPPTTSQTPILVPDPTEQPCLAVDVDEGYDDIVDGQSMLDMIQSLPRAPWRRNRGSTYVPYRSAAEAAIGCRDLVHKPARMRKRITRRKHLQRGATEAGADTDECRTKRARHTSHDSSTHDEAIKPSAAVPCA